MSRILDIQNHVQNSGHALSKILDIHVQNFGLVSPEFWTYDVQNFGHDFVCPELWTCLVLNSGHIPRGILDIFVHNSGQIMFRILDMVFYVQNSGHFCVQNSGHYVSRILDYINCSKTAWTNGNKYF